MMSSEQDPQFDELEDRLMDQALEETLGKQHPPDLSGTVFERAKTEGVLTLRSKERSLLELMKTNRAWRWTAEATAVVLVIGTLTALLLPAIQSARESAGKTDYWKSKSKQILPAMIAGRGEYPSDPGWLPSSTPDQGVGPGSSGDQYGRIVENEFLRATDSPLSTFSIDVDTASYANVRQYLTQSHALPPPDAVRIEELVNYFDYDYEPPSARLVNEDISADDDSQAPFAAHMEIANCPWAPQHRLVRIGLKGREIERDARPPSNLVFLLDVSGSMDQPNKLPLLVRGMKLLAGELGENDRVAIVVYASSEGLALPSTSGFQKERILSALDQLSAGGSTAGGAGIELAYKIAQQNFIKEGTNRVILCTDGDFNVGVTSPAALERMAEQKAKSGVFLTVLGFGRGNLNDQMMESISNRGNGNYHYIDNLSEARKVLVEELGGTLITIAKDVKIQVEFNPAQVAAYRLIGYENRILAAKDFNDDKKDAGEIGAGHTVTALYEIVPVGAEVASGTDDTARAALRKRLAEVETLLKAARDSDNSDSQREYEQERKQLQDALAELDVAAKPPTPAVDPLKYQQPSELSPAADGGELLTLKLRYKQPEGETSRLLTFPLSKQEKPFGQASGDFQFASAVASFGMLLRHSKYAGDATYDSVLEIAAASRGSDQHGYRQEFLEIVRLAKEINGQ